MSILCDVTLYIQEQQSANALTATITISSSSNECRDAGLPANRKRCEFWMQSSVLPNLTHMLFYSLILIFLQLLL